MIPERVLVIENPTLNAPYSVPARHFRFDDEGIRRLRDGNPRIPTVASHKRGLGTPEPVTDNE